MSDHPPTPDTGPPPEGGPPPAADAGHAAADPKLDAALDALTRAAGKQADAAGRSAVASAALGQVVARLTPPRSDPPVPDGHVRVYHGAQGGDPSGWASTDRKYAENFRRGEDPNDLYYADLPKSHALVRDHLDRLRAELGDRHAERSFRQGYTFDGGADLARMMRPLPRPDESADRGGGPAPAGKPDFTQAALDHLARSKGAQSRGYTPEVLAKLSPDHVRDLARMAGFKGPADAAAGRSPDAPTPASPAAGGDGNPAGTADRAGAYLDRAADLAGRGKRVVAREADAGTVAAGARGAVQGAEMGAEGGPYGAAIGAVVGAALGVAAHKAAEKAAGNANGGKGGGGGGGNGPPGGPPGGDESWWKKAGNWLAGTKDEWKTVGRDAAPHAARGVEAAARDLNVMEWKSLPDAVHKLVDFNRAVDASTRGLLDQARGLGEYSASMAQVLSEREAREVFRKNDVGEREAASARFLAESEQRRKDNVKAIEVLTDKIDNYATGVLNLLAALIAALPNKAVEEILKKLGMWEKEGDGTSPLEWMEKLSAEDDRLRRQAEDRLREMQQRGPGVPR